MSNVQVKKVVGYVTLPGIIPRARHLLTSGFGYIAFLMAHIYAMVRLLPPNHPYIISQNIGKFGVRHVIAEAANNLVVSRKNIDQILIFAALLVGVVILLAQFVLILYVIILKPALAGSIFETPSPSSGPMIDIAFVLLDSVFGIPKLYCNTGGICTDVLGSPQTPWPFHQALHSLFRFYSTGLLLIGSFIFLYYVVVVVGEAATTGSPFGQRFQSWWAPIRLVVALGLLLPINYGLNSGQYIALYAAKLGSGLATNGWLRFNNTISGGTSGSVVFATGGANPLGERETLLARPAPPDITPLVRIMSMVHACAYTYWKLDGTNTSIDTNIPPSSNFFIKPYLVKNTRPWMPNSDARMELFTDTPYVDALSFYNNSSDIIIRFGEIGDNSTANPDDFREETGEVLPYCGDIRIAIGDLSNIDAGMAGTASIGGADWMQEFYFNLVKRMWFGTGGNEPDDTIRQFSHRYMEVALETGTPRQCLTGAPDMGCKGVGGLPSCTGANPAHPDCMTKRPGTKERQYLINLYQAELNANVVAAWALYNSKGTDIQITKEVLDRGWAGAGIWYNTINQVNGAFSNSVINTPSRDSYPLIMEKVAQKKRQTEDKPSADIFSPSFADGTPVKVTVGGETDSLLRATKLNDFHKFWTDGTTNQISTKSIETDNAFIDTMNLLFGTQGLMDMRKANASIHPLAQLSALGKGLVDAAVRNVLGGSLIALGEGFAKKGPLASSITVSLAFIGLTAGLVLFYILPFLPFLYFFFAAAEWVKGIFESMVGVPLWALAHLRIDGDGLSGESANNGYFLIFEIFLRPILIVFGLIASMVIFTAQVRILNFTWDIVLDNLTGYEADVAVLGAQDRERGVTDQFFYTIIYAIIVYMMATASFKLINSIPDNMLRWMGASVSSFGDINQDPTEGLTRYAALGGMTIGQQAAGSISKFSGDMGGVLGKLNRSGE